MQLFRNPRNDFGFAATGPAGPSVIGRQRLTAERKARTQRHILGYLKILFDNMWLHV